MHILNNNSQALKKKKNHSQDKLYLMTRESKRVEEKEMKEKEIREREII